jgi:hypothetical protein
MSRDLARYNKVTDANSKLLNANIITKEVIELALMDINEVVEYFKIAKPTALRLFATKGSPAFKIGGGRGHWRVDSEKLEKFLMKQSERDKG